MARRQRALCLLVWGLARAVDAVDCKGQVAGDKLWMCPDIDLVQCPLSFVRTGFEPGFVQCGVVGKYCSACVAMEKAASLGGLGEPLPAGQELRPKGMASVGSRFFRLSSRGVVINECIFVKGPTVVVLMPMVHVAAKSFFDATLRSTRFHQFDAVYHEGPPPGCTDDPAYPTWRFTPSLRHASPSGAFLELCWIFWFRVPLAVSNKMCKMLGWQPLALQPEPMRPSTETPRFECTDSTSVVETALFMASLHRYDPRADRLVAALIEAAPGRYAVPWGLAHMRYIEQQLRANGFAPSQEFDQEHAACSWGTAICAHVMIWIWWWFLHASADAWFIWHHTGYIVIKMPLYWLCHATLRIGDSAVTHEPGRAEPVAKEAGDIRAMQKWAVEWGGTCARQTADPEAAGLVASCLARLRQADDVLLKGAERAVCAASTKDPKALIQCSMVLHAIATLRPQRRPEALAEILLELLQRSHLTDGGLCPQALQRSCLAILQAEVKWADAQDRPSALLWSVAERLQGLARAEPWRLGRAGLRTAARALGRWGHSCEPLAETAPRFLEALERKLPSAERVHAGLQPSVLLECLGSAVPFANHSNGRRSAQKIFKHLVEKAATLRAGQLVALAELSALWQASGMHDEESDDDDQMKKPLKHQIASLGAELYRRSRELPLRAIPRALAALLQLVPAESQEADFLPLLRRCTGRLGYRLGELLDANATQHERLENFDIDALGEVLYVCAAARYTDDSFLETSKRWVLHDNAADLKEMRRNVTAIHLLHSFSLLKVARGDLLHRLVAEAKGKLEQFSAFEVLGFLDAAAILQAESDKPVPSAFIFDESDQQGPPPSGIGEEALHAVLQRLSELLPLLDDDELYTCLNLASSIRLPEGCTLSDMEQEAAKRGMLEAEKWNECQSKLHCSTLHAASPIFVHHVARVASSKAYTGQLVCDTIAIAMC
eukprot:s1420_g15.t1